MKSIVLGTYLVGKDLDSYTSSLSLTPPPGFPPSRRRRRSLRPHKPFHHQPHRPGPLPRRTFRFLPFRFPPANRTLRFASWLRLHFLIRSAGPFATTTTTIIIISIVLKFLLFWALDPELVEACVLPVFGALELLDTCGARLLCVL